MTNFPKIIWFFWHQGFYEAPDFVKMCIFSWKFRHPNYTINILDQYSVHDYIEIPTFINLNRKDITYQKYANYVRLLLLKEYGGIWIDANIYCFKPLNSWLGNYSETGIFLFENSFKDRLIANWFIAATPNHYMIEEWLAAYEDFFKKNSFENTYTKYGKMIRKKLRKNFSQNIRQTTIWFSFFIVKILKIYPYLVMHYLFNQLYLNDKKFKNTWDGSKKMSACDFDIRCLWLNNKTFEDSLHLYQSKQLYLFKLSQKVNFSEPFFADYMKFILADYETIKSSPI